MATQGAPAADAAKGAPAAAKAADVAATSAAAAAAAVAAKKKDVVPYSRLFLFATPADKAMVAVGVVAACLSGVIFPLFTLVFGKLLNTLGGSQAGFAETVKEYALYFLLIAIGAAITGCIETWLPMVAAENQMREVRSRYVRALLRQDAGWHDTNRTGEAASRLAEETVLWQAGIGEKLTGAIKFSITFVAGLAVGFSKSWVLTLVIFACTPVLVFIIGFLKVATAGYESDAAKAYARAGDACAEVFALIRTVAAFGGEEAEVRRYDSHLAVSERAGRGKGRMFGVAVGGIFGTMFAVYGVATYTGMRLILASREGNVVCRYNPLAAGCFSGGDVISCFMAVLIGAFALGQAGPNVAAFGSAQAAAFRILQTIERVPAIDIESDKGHVPAPGSESEPASIEFKDVTFAYPSRPDECVLRGFSLSIAKGSTVALVGESGSGKSTLIQLLERYYDPQSGSVHVDGVDVREWNVRALRARIGLVSQDPILFGVSVGENIGFGKDGLVAASDDEIAAAARAANAFGFVSALPEGFKTLVGTSVSSAQLSGGQRQRICIARAIIRNPRILLLDEATSALDTESERVVQESIDALLSGSTKRTTVLIAHRLSTVRNATLIVVMSKGAIVEQGTHEQLMALGAPGHYARLRALQDTGGVARSASSLALKAAAVAAEAEGVRKAPAADKSDFEKTNPAFKHAKPTAGGDDKEADKKPADKEKEKDKIEDDGAAPVDPWRVWRMQAGDWPLMLVALLASAAAGSVQPLFSVVYSEMITSFFKPDDADMQAASIKLVGYFFGIAALNFFATFLRIASFSYLGEKLTRRLRVLTFAALLRQPAAFYDDARNSAGRLQSRLNYDAAFVRGGTGEALGVQAQSFAAIAAAAIIAFVASWRLALVMCCVAPLMVVAAKAGNTAFVGFSKGSVAALAESGHVATEAMSGIRTVAAFNLQEQTRRTFDALLATPLTLGRKAALRNGFQQGFAALMMFITYSLAFYVGAIFITQGSLDFNALMRVFLATTMASQAIGSASSWGPDKAKCDLATRNIFGIIDAPSKIDASSAEGAVQAASAEGRIELRNVRFSYPSRPDALVLDDFSLVLEPGTTTALVGESGSGKSSVVALVERFYDCSSGSVLVDGIDVKAWNVRALRQQMALVQQEPSLYADSIAYNIGYGRADGAKPEIDKGVPQDASADSTTAVVKGDGKDSVASSTAASEKAAAKELADAAARAAAVDKVMANFTVDANVRQAAKDANALTFIDVFKHGFATHVGARGSQLSGGQKQRLAIARAIIRNPRILLLDEATSALDSESERVVQAALDALLARGAAAEGGRRRTTLVVAHRLSTIKNADLIVVVGKGGRILERGTFAELMARDGPFRALADAQAHSSDTGSAPTTAPATL